MYRVSAINSLLSELRVNKCYYFSDSSSSSDNTVILQLEYGCDYIEATLMKIGATIWVVSRVHAMVPIRKKVTNLTKFFNLIRISSVQVLKLNIHVIKSNI